MSVSEAPTNDLLVHLTPEAIGGVGKMIEKYELDPTRAGLRVAVSKGGCSGYMYDVRVAEEPVEGDTVIMVEGVRVFVDDESKPVIKGLTVDWVSSMQEQRFVFKNPNATGGCGCGESFSA